MSLRLITGFAVALLLGGHAAQGAIYISGHADIGVGFENNNLHLHIHAEDAINLYGGGTLPAGEYDPDAMMIGVPNPSIARPSGSQWDFLARNAGDPVWFLPQNDDPAKPFLGLATEELMTSDGWSTITWTFNSITTVSGDNSEFSMWRETLGINVLASTLDAGADTWTQGAGGHDHQGFGFTGQGIYDVSFTVEASNAGVDYSDTATFRFVTGTAVPEPSSLVVVGLAAGCIAARRRRRP